MRRQNRHILNESLIIGGATAMVEVFIFNGLSIKTREFILL
jgi:hypothetical protein